ncbi:IclR family transcriptional regulator [Shinella zoogloeoides]|uniref:IclR family transcriptional regulator n=1 Tax=Shinella zoogloeoides TaxID=352475 RepID=UPI00299D39B0|nr:IclR family transcriptional regulator [Shinella zoogloeoides]WPE22666.1 HTH-type transcriptional regulator XynR [Shinella zoogloeoides]
MEKSEEIVQGTQSLARAFSVLDAVADGNGDLASIGRVLGTSRSTTHRLVSFLQRSGFVRHVDGRGYVLGARLIELGSAALAQMPLTSVARPLLERLSQQTGDTIHLSVRDGDEIMYVDKISGNKGLEMRSRVGLRKPIAITGTGKAQMLDLPEKEWNRLYALAQIAILSDEMPPPGFLPWEEYVAAMREYRARGYTMEVEENEASICCVAAPIRGARGEIVAGLSIASTLPYMTRQRLTALVPLVTSCAEDISRELGFTRK